MIRLLFGTLASTIALSACASNAAAAPRGATFLAAARLGGEAAGAAPQTLAVNSPATRQIMAGGRTTARPPARAEAAHKAAVRKQSQPSHIGAVQLYAWTEGAVYRLNAAPGQVTDIALQPGEALISVAAGDTARWVVGDTSSGAGAGRRTHILIKPIAAGLKTNLVIATDRRVYHLALESNPTTAMASISWSYPDDPLLALRADQGAGETRVAADVGIEALNFNYRIEGDKPAWRPVRAFDDGRQVFIEFPPGFAQGEAPPLFVTGAGGRAELVNYRLRGRYYVVDRLFAAAELRLGERRQQVVRIIREDPSRGRRG